MPGSQHVHEEPGFRHSLTNCQVGLLYLFIYLFYFEIKHLLNESNYLSFGHRECINIVCETAGLKTVDKKRKVKKKKGIGPFIHSFSSFYVIY